MDTARKLKPQIALACLRLALLPIARLCLRHAVKLSELVELCKQVMLSAAREEIALSKERVTASRLSVMTGVHRRDIQRLESSEASQTLIALNLSARLIGHWQSDAEFCSSEGKPRDLSFGFEGSEFSSLVRKVCKELNPATILFELLRIGAVSRSNQKLSLVEMVYAPRGDMEFGYKIVSSDLDDVILAVEENIAYEPEIPNLHTRTEYDNVRPSALPEIRKWLLVEGRRLHARARHYISQFDQDLNPTGEIQELGAKVVLSSFSKVYDKKAGDK